MNDEVACADPQTLGDSKDLFIFAGVFDFVVFGIERLNFVSEDFDYAILLGEPVASSDIVRKHLSYTLINLWARYLQKSEDSTILFKSIIRSSFDNLFKHFSENIYDSFYI